MIYYTADTHFGHKNIIKYCERPFKSASHMDEVIIKNWNAIVKPEDTIFHLGDFSMEKNPERIEKWLSRLNGT